MTWLRIVTDIDAPVSRVWTALTDPAEVQAWDGVEPADVPAEYPQPGQVARWHLSFGNGIVREVPLYDRVRRVEPERLLQAEITYLFARIDETYALSTRPGPERWCRLLTVAGIDSPVAPLTPLAEQLVVPAVRGAMKRLKAHCETGTAPTRQAKDTLTSS